MAKFNSKRNIFLAAVIGLLIFFHVLGFLKPFETILARILNPVFAGLYSLGSSLRLAYQEQTKKVDLNERAAELEVKINQLTVENAGLKLMEEENRTLREHLRFLTKNNYNYIIGNVISRGDLTDLSNTTQTIIIDKGARDGLYPGLAVVSSAGIMAGKIVEVKDYIAKVYLTNNPDCKLAVTMLNENKTAGIAEGELGLTIKMSFIPNDIAIKAGETVVTSGLEQPIPRGLVVGSVVRVSQDSHDIWQSATIEPLVEPDSLSIVSVILP